MEILKDINEATTFATVGAIVGVGVFHTLGGAGLAIGGTAYPIGVVTFAGAGAVVGLAAYGTKKSVLG